MLTIGQLHPSPLLVRSCLKSYVLGFSIMWTKNFQMSKLGLEKEEEPENKLPTFTGSLRNQGNSRKTTTCVELTMLKLLVCVDHNKLWKILKEMGIPGHLTCLLRKLYAGQEATVRALCGTTDWFHIEKGVWQCSLLSSFSLYTELQVGIKIGRRNINNLRYVDDTTLIT